MSTQRTSADVIAINSAEEIVGIINEAERIHPEFRLFPAGVVPKTSYKTIVRTALPTAGFRAIGAGRTRNRGTLVARDVACKFLDGSWDIDNQAVTGVDWGDPLADEREASLLAVISAACIQIWYGTDADESGFAGIASLMPYADTDLVIDAGGTTAGTGSSVFMLRLDSRQGVCFAWGNGGKIEAGEVTDQQLYDGDGKPYMGKAQAVEGWIGLQLTNYNAMGRICNLTADSGKGLTDDLLAELYGEFPVGQKPNAIFMNRRSLGQLRNSRTATNDSGKPAPFPTEWEGIEIGVTDSILSNETLLENEESSSS